MSPKKKRMPRAFEPIKKEGRKKNRRLFYPELSFIKESVLKGLKEEEIISSFFKKFGDDLDISRMQCKVLILNILKKVTYTWIWDNDLGKIPEERHVPRKRRTREEIEASQVITTRTYKRIAITDIILLREELTDLQAGNFNLNEFNGKIQGILDFIDSI